MRNAHEPVWLNGAPEVGIHIPCGPLLAPEQPSSAGAGYVCAELGGVCGSDTRAVEHLEHKLCYTLQCNQIAHNLSYELQRLTFIEMSQSIRI